jgi:hypothetical protein
VQIVYLCNVNQRIYIDTTVVGGAFDNDFMDATKYFFNKAIESRTVFVISKLLEFEISYAPENVKLFFASLPQDLLEYVELTEEAKSLATLYIDEKVVGKSSLADCQHIAIATINRVNVLVSWNFKHIVNLPRIHGYNSTNMKQGYHTLEIRTPKEIFNND